MKVLAATVVLVLASLAVGDEVKVKRSPVEDYHQRIGIPLATRIRQSEEEAEKAGLAGQRIVGGSVTDISQVPHQVGLVIQILFIFTSVCGGSMISQTRIITAAHCHNTPGIIATGFTAVLGSNTLFSGGVRVSTNDISVHPNWDAAEAVHDIAVLRIPAVTYTNVIQPIALPNGAEINNDFAGWTGHASGFGLTADGSSIGTNQVLSSIFLRVITNSECSQTFGPYIRDSIVCTNGVGGVGTCSGDSGGPLTVDSAGRKILIGVTSFGDADGCQTNAPAAFTRISHYLSWVLAQ